MPKAEVMFWQRVKGKQLLGLDFHRQKPIQNYIVDFFCPLLKLIIEIDGFSHDYKIDYDLKREVALKKLGLSVLHFRDREVLENIEVVIQRVVDWIELHTTDGSKLK